MRRQSRLAVAVLLLTAPSLSLPTCPSGFSLAANAVASTSRCYKLVSYAGAGVEWVKARSDCSNFVVGLSTMATIRNAEQGSAVVTALCAGLGSTATRIWIGFYSDRGYPGVYGTISGGLGCNVPVLGRNNPCADKTSWV